MKQRNVMYVVITIICIVAIGIAVFYQVFKTDNNISSNDNQDSNNINNANVDTKTIDLEKIKSEFNSLFTNKLNLQEYEVPENIKKLNEGKEIIYTGYEIKQEKEDKYNLNINLPIFNISSDTANNYNKITQQVFADKANEIILGEAVDADIYSIYNIDYTAYLNDNILSLVIKSTLKEGTKAQRVIVQTYNYDLQTAKEADLLDILEEKEISKESVNNKIEEYVTYAYNNSQAVQAATSQTVYKRDLNSAIYLVDNVNSFFLGEDGKIYIVYAYGNSNFTSEIDIIEI